MRGGFILALATVKSTYDVYISYSFAYPFSLRDGTTACEIDKSAGVFIALSSDALGVETATIEGALDGLNLNNQIYRSK